MPHTSVLNKPSGALKRPQSSDTSLKWVKVGLIMQDEITGVL